MTVHEIGHVLGIGWADDGFFGWSVALGGATALIGAWRDADPNGDNAGAAYVFNLE